MKPENATIKLAQVSKAPFENTIGTLRSDNGAGVRENLAEKYSASFRIISQLSQVTQLRREFTLEMKRGGRTVVQTEMLEFIALPFSSSKKKLKFGHFTSKWFRDGRQRNARAELLFC